MTEYILWNGISICFGFEFEFLIRITSANKTQFLFLRFPTFSTKIVLVLDTLRYPKKKQKQKTFENVNECKTYLILFNTLYKVYFTFICQEYFRKDILRFFLAQINFSHTFVKLKVLLNFLIEIQRKFMVNKDANKIYVCFPLFFCSFGHIIY